MKVVRRGAIGVIRDVRCDSYRQRLDGVLQGDDKGDGGKKEVGG